VKGAETVEIAGGRSRLANKNPFRILKNFTIIAKYCHGSRVMLIFINKIASVGKRYAIHDCEVSDKYFMECKVSFDAGLPVKPRVDQVNAERRDRAPSRCGGTCSR
jgi:hypothetical protein